eukprot:gene9281-11376_t
MSSETLLKRAFPTGNLRRNEEFDVSIITQVSVERLERVAMMADKWRAPISAAVYIKSKSDIDDVRKLIANSYSVSTFVDFHFLYFNNTRYPVNNLRNLALRNSRTDWNLLMDVDFLPPITLYKYLEGYTKETEKNDLISYVIPSFSSGLSRFNLPDLKSDLINSINNKTIVPTNVEICKKCHAPTNYTRWYTAPEPYEAVYRWIYEPFLVYRKSQINDYDQRLKGYGWDKNSHTFGMAAAGFKFIVLPEGWIVHMDHPTKAWEGTDTYSEQMV